jgi:hypothetical protein
MKHECHEVDKAHERFKELATNLFRAPKPTKPETVRTPKKTSKG